MLKKRRLRIMLQGHFPGHHPTRIHNFIRIPDFGHAIRGKRSDSHLLGFIHVIGHEVQTDCRLYPSQGIVMRETLVAKIIVAGLILVIKDVALLM
jgi:hypothetical protein